MRQKFYGLIRNFGNLITRLETIQAYSLTEAHDIIYNDMTSDEELWMLTETDLKDIRNMIDLKIGRDTSKWKPVSRLSYRKYVLGE